MKIFGFMCIVLNLPRTVYLTIFKRHTEDQLM